MRDCVNCAALATTRQDALPNDLEHPIASPIGALATPPVPMPARPDAPPHPLWRGHGMYVRYEGLE